MRKIQTTNVTQNSSLVEERRKIFSDINLDAGTTSPKETVSNIDAVNQNVMVILGTPKKSWWWGPNKGGFIGKYLFDPIDSDTAYKLRSEIIDALQENNEYRIVYKEVYVEADMAAQEYFVQIVYDVPQLRLADVPFAFKLSRNF